MATTLSLTDDTLTFNMYSGNFYLAAEGWEAEFTADEKWEVFPLKSKAVEGTIRSELNTLDKLVENARKYTSNALESNTVWINFMSPTETAKRAVVYEITYTMRSAGRMGPLLVTSGAFVDVSVRHGPWETTASTFTATLTASGKSSGCDGVYASTATNTVRGRISSLSFVSSMTEFWFGLRDARLGTATFEPFWECELGTEGFGTIETSVANARGGKVARCTAPSGTPFLNLTVRWSNVGSGDDIAGDYLVLMRLSSNNTAAKFRISCTSSGADTNLGADIGEVYWSCPTTSYFCNVPIGRVTFPLGPNRGGVLSAALSNQAINVYVTRVAGSGSDYLDMDTIILIPLDHFVYINNATGTVSVKTMEDGSIAVLTGGGSVLPVTAINWNFPVGTFAWVFASNIAAGVANDTGTVTSMSMTGYSRYQSFIP